MDKSVRDLLEKPFDKKYVSTRKGNGGRDLSYVEGAQYIQRLNDAAEGQWSYSIVDRFTSERPTTQKGRAAYDLVVVVEVRAFGETRQAFGGSVSPNGECLGDDWKSALTDALKKAIASFGVALEYYCKGELSHEDLLEEATTEAEQPAKAPEQRPLTKRQADSIKAIAKSLGWTPEVLKQHCSDSYQVTSLELLSAADASSLIAELQKLTVKNAQPQPSSSTPTPVKAEKPITRRQIESIQAIARALGWAPETLTAHCARVYSSLLKDLTEVDAAALIAELTNMSTGKATAAEACAADVVHPKGKGVTIGQLAALRALREKFGWDGKALIAAIGDPMSLSKDQAQKGLEELQKKALEVEGATA